MKQTETVVNLGTRYRYRLLTKIRKAVKGSYNPKTYAYQLFNIHFLTVSTTNWKWNVHKHHICRNQ